MKTGNIKSKQSHYELLLRAYDKAQAALERAKTNEKTAKHYMKTADKDVSKTDVAILELEYKRAMFRRKGRKAAFRIAKLRLKQWLKLHEEDIKLYQLNAESEKKDEGKSEEKVAVASNKATAAAKASATEQEAPKPKRKSRTPSAKETAVAKVSATEIETSKPQRKPRTPSAKTKKQKATTIDFTIIEGIGPKVSDYLQAAGISSFEQLVKAKVETIKEILFDKKLKFINPSTWAEQAQLVVDGKLEDLRNLQEQLSRGRRV